MRTYLTLLMLPVLATVLSFLPAAAVLADPANTWTKLAENRTGSREGSVLLAGPKSDQMLLFGGTVKGVPYVQSFNIASRTWSEFWMGKPATVVLLRAKSWPSARVKKWVGMVIANDPSRSWKVVDVTAGTAVGAPQVTA